MRWRKQLWISGKNAYIAHVRPTYSEDVNAYMIHPDRVWVRGGKRAWRWALVSKSRANPNWRIIAHYRTMREAKLATTARLAG